MTTSETPPNDREPRDAANWAQQHTHTLRVENVPSGALNRFVDGRQIIGPLQGFGPMWQKTYRISLKGAAVEPATVISTWKEHFAEFWPTNARFFGPLTGIAPGEVALLHLKIGGVPLSTGVFVLYADEESFTLMTPQGHAFAGWITFSSYEDNGEIIAQAQVLMRASDPIYELGLRFGGHKQEDNFWCHTLGQLAKFFGAEAPVQFERICVNKKIQWAEARNVWQNSAVRTTLYTVRTPSSWFVKRVK